MSDVVFVISMLSLLSLDGVLGVLDLAWALPRSVLPERGCTLADVVVIPELAIPV